MSWAWQLIYQWRYRLSLKADASVLTSPRVFMISAVFLTTLFSLFQTVYANVIIPCSGTYTAKQAYLSGQANGQGAVIQGKRSLGNIELEVLACGEKISLSSQGMTTILDRIEPASNTFTGSRQGTPDLTFTMDLETPKLIKGQMIATDNGLTIKRPLALTLLTGVAPDLKNCQKEQPPKSMHSNMLSLASVLTRSGIFPAKGLHYRDYIQEGKLNYLYEDSEFGTIYYETHSLSFYVDKEGAILPKVSDDRKLAGECSPKVKRLARASKMINVKINQYVWAIHVFVQVIDIEKGGKITEQYEATKRGKGYKRVTNVMQQAWKKVKLPVRTMSDGSVTTD